MKPVHMLEKGNTLIVHPLANGEALNVKQELISLNVTITARTKDGFLQSATIVSRQDGELLLFNNTPSALLCVSNDIQVGIYGDFIQVIHDCPIGEYFTLTLENGRVYELSYVV